MEIKLPEFTPNPSCTYKYDYPALLEKMAGMKVKDQLGYIRTLILCDLFFILQFVMEIPGANRPFVVDACREVEDGPEGGTLDLWARKHYKTTILNQARTLQRALKYPERCTMICSYSRPIAIRFMRPIKLLFETSDLLKACFPDVLYQNPRDESPKWAEYEGIILKRRSVARKEGNIEAWGIIEGMPTSSHFDFIVVDDLETRDTVDNPDVVRKVNESFDLLDDLLTEGGHISVIGTPYSHNATYYPFIIEKRRANGEPAFKLRRKPATHDGSALGASVLLAQEELDDIRARKGEYIFNCQQLINPTPSGARRLSNNLRIIKHEDVPQDIYKFMVVDPAGGDNKLKKADAWAIGVFGVKPMVDEVGGSEVYLLDCFIESVTKYDDGPDMVARMYMAGGLIMQLGVEKEATDTAYLHIQNILKAHGKYVSEDAGNLVLLRSRGRKKEAKIDQALAWPLANGKIFISDKVAGRYIDRLKQELEKFPFWHDDGLDMLAYLYSDILPAYNFPARRNDKWKKQQAINYGVV